MAEITIYNVERAVTSKVGKQVLGFLCLLWLLYFACCLMVVNISIKFDDNIKLPSGHKYMTEITNYTVQRAIT